MILTAPIMVTMYFMGRLHRHDLASPSFNRTRCVEWDTNKRNYRVLQHSISRRSEYTRSIVRFVS